jgi:hypothetical protein
MTNMQPFKAYVVAYIKFLSIHPSHMQSFPSLSCTKLYQVLRSIENEHYFNTLYFMKGKLHNHLIAHLDLCVKHFHKIFYNIKCFSCIKP